MKSKFVICIISASNEDILPGKVYQVLEDEKADRENYIRIMDESGEDYLYPSTYFVPISLPQAAEQALFRSSNQSFPPA